MVVDNLLFSVACAAGTDLSDVLVDNLTKDVILGEVLFHKCKESWLDVCTDVLTK